MGTRYKGSKKEVTVLDTFIKLTRAADTVTSKLNLTLSHNKMTISQFGILDAVYHLGPLTQKELGEKILKSGGNITHVVDNLEKQGFVKRQRGKNDRRNFEIHITAKGRNKFSKLLPVIVNLIKEQFNNLNNDELETIQELCKKIGLKNDN